MRYFLAYDHGGHLCAIPVDKRPEWDAFVRIFDDQEAAWELPPFVIPAEQTSFTFTDPQP